MKTNFFFKAFLIGMLALLLSVFLIKNQQGVTQFNHRLLLPDFDAFAVSAITLQNNHGLEQLEVKKVEENWQLASKFDYPANKEKLSKLMQGLKDAKIVELKTQLENNYARLGVQSLSASANANLSSSQANLNEAEPTLLTLKTKDSTVELIIGGKSKTTNGRYVRFVDEAQSYLTDLNLELPKTGSDWLAPNLLSISLTQISQVDITLQDDGFSLVRRSQASSGSNSKTPDRDKPVALTSIDKADTEFTLMSTEKDEVKQPKYTSIFTGLVRNIINMTVKDVRTINTNIDQMDLELYQTIKLTYQGPNLVQSEQLLQVYVDRQHQHRYWIRVDKGKWLLAISEFDVNQISKPLSDYFE